MTSGEPRDIAIAISVAQSAVPQGRAYIANNLPEVSKVVSFGMPAGPGQQAVAGGGHGASLAEQVSNRLREMKAHHRDAVVHIFAACPNALLFFLGQGHQGVAPASSTNSISTERGIRVTKRRS